MGSEIQWLSATQYIKERRKLMDEKKVEKVEERHEERRQ
jgi:hypothetical protein